MEKWEVQQNKLHDVAITMTCASHVCTSMWDSSNTFI